jgi:hypothetical protein
VFLKFPGLDQLPVKPQRVEAAAVDPRHQIVAHSPPRRPTLAGHGEHVGVDAAFPGVSADGDRRRAHREIAQLCVVTKRLADREGRRNGQAREKQGVRQEQGHQCHGGNIP